MDIEELIQYYTDLLIIQYNDRPKARATISLMVEEMLANGVITDIRDAFNIDTAVGEQLDILGKYIGLSRTYSEEVYDSVFFGFSDYTEVEPADVEGFTDASDFLTKDGEFLEASDAVAVENLLNDDSYRILLKLKIKKNYSNASNKFIDDSIFETFGSELRAIETYNMMMVFFIDPNYSKIIQVAFQKGVIPIPMAVGIQAIIPDVDGYFSFTSALIDHDSDFEGFSSASDFLTKDGTFLGVDDFIEL